MVTLPSAQAAAQPKRNSNPPHYRPVSAHFRIQSLNTDSSSTSNASSPPSLMERSSGSPEYSDANDTLSAPSEYLAEVCGTLTINKPYQGWILMKREA